MKRTCLTLLLIASAVWAVAGVELKMSRAELMNRIKGGWAGQTIGCTYGGPTEFCWRAAMIPDNVAITWNDSAVVRFFDRSPGLYDDIYMDLTFLEVMGRLGLDAPIDSFAVAYATAGYNLWHANQVGRYNIKRGIMPPASGHWRNNPHADDIDYQIEADYAGLISPAMPNTASDISDRIGHIMNYGNGWYGGVLVGAMYSLAFTTNDIETLIRRSLQTIPRKSTFYQCMADVLKWYHQSPNDWKKTWQCLEDKWCDEIGCSEGVKAPLNIDAMINCAYVLVGLLYGQGDFEKTMEISTRCGQDSDCNPATAAGILGTMQGYDAIPDVWKRSLRFVNDRPFAHTSLSLNATYDLNLRLALDNIQRHGGRVDGETVTIRTQQPKAVRFEQSFEGLAVDTVYEKITYDRLANFPFTGCGIVISGYLKKQAGPATPTLLVSVDGELKQELPFPASYHDRCIDLCWMYDLPQGPHMLSIRTADPQPGEQIVPLRVIVYKKAK